MKIGNASGTQIAFFAFAVLLLAVPLSRWIGGLLPWSPAERNLIESALPILVGVALLFGVPSLRRWLRAELSRPLPAVRYREVLVTGALVPLVAFAAAGALVALAWLADGPAGVAGRMQSMETDELQMSNAMHPVNVTRTMLLVAALGPLVEELVFRGMLFRTWERKWGWLASMLLSCLVFALYHVFSLHAFMLGVVFVCLYRRTGTLWAPIAVHAFYNLSMWYPLLGRHVFQRYIDAPGQLGDWTFHLVCLATATVAIPAYVWLSRDAALGAAPGARRHPAHEPLPQ